MKDKSEKDCLFWGVISYEMWLFMVHCSFLVVS